MTALPLTTQELLALRALARTVGDQFIQPNTPSGGGMSIKSVNLADLSTERWNVVKGLSGACRVHFSRRSSSAGALLEVKSPELSRFAPGDTLHGLISDQLEVRLRSDSVAVGSAVFLASRRPDVFLEESDGPGSSGADSLATYTQLYDVATDNRPTSNATAGLPLAGLKALRIRVQAPSGATLVAGTVALWLYDLATGLWGRSQASFGDLSEAAGLRVWQSLDFEVGVPIGYAFAEVVSGTHSAGAGVFDVRMQGVG